MARRSAPSALGMVLSSMMILLLLSGCSNDVSKTQQEETTVTAASGIEFDPHMPYAPGEFNAEDPNFTLRNICEDYTDDMAAELELGKRLPNVEEPSSEHGYLCQFVPKTRMESFDDLFLVNDSFAKEQIENNLVIFQDPHQSRIPGVYSYLLSPHDQYQCTAAYASNSGRVNLTYFDFDLRGRPEALCNNAVQTLEKIIIRIGGSL
ncbi:DUF3558 domain-containing protein [Corynebacterium poyangense]|uniref:DUF3558 domain-containing protein n=1 Tax=Corynebacterium poyangense TaxID=2684405 RepID=A0A7H0SRX6_9CORY|nr:hypothetical protein [Corynebacterium poyangense]MBZ8177243.1 hypothetical protein [Corynebacterium poyangense]QNQ91301.1 DUF3558 domain-containing protein [Corynebacterium poyangense]